MPTEGQSATPECCDLHVARDPSSPEQGVAGWKNRAATFKRRTIVWQSRRRYRDTEPQMRSG